MMTKELRFFSAAFERSWNFFSKLGIYFLCQAFRVLLNYVSALLDRYSVRSMISNSDIRTAEEALKNNYFLVVL